MCPLRFSVCPPLRQAPFLYFRSQLATHHAKPLRTWMPAQTAQNLWKDSAVLDARFAGLAAPDEGLRLRVATRWVVGDPVQ